MNLKQFIEKYQNKSVDFDGAYSAQCVDLFNQYLVDVLKIENPIQMFPVMSAFQIYDRAEGNELFLQVKNDPMAIPRPGDIMIWGKSAKLPHGHVGIFISGDVMKFKSFDQNWPLGALCGPVEHDYNGVIGWIRYIKQPDIVTPQITLPNLDGYKTYIIAGTVIATVILHQAGYINDEMLNVLDTLFLALLGFSLRDAIKKK
jgi:hypothetical protein